MTETWREAIECPVCHLKQMAEVSIEDGEPFASYVHVCTGCGYTITESEWDHVNASEVEESKL